VLSAVAAVAARLDATGIRWQLAGSAGQLLRGERVRPGDVDVEVHAHDAVGAARALGLPGPRYAAGGGWSSWRTGGLIAGVPVDLSGGLEVRGKPAASGAPAPGVLVAMDADTVPVRVGSGLVRVISPGEALARALVAGDAGRTAKARASLPGEGTARAAALAYCDARRAAAAASAAR
jgi:hypothetical protein